MHPRRVDRVGHLIQMELSQLIVTKLRDPRLGFITITHVSVAPDLKNAIVFYSALGDPKVRASAQTALEHAAGFLQKQIALAIKIRYTPKLRFQYDDSLDQGMAVDRVLREIKKEEQV
jgi:ribosome-binding factor A